MIQLDKEYRIYGGRHDYFLQRKQGNYWKTTSYHANIPSAYKKYANTLIKKLIIGDIVEEDIEAELPDEEEVEVIRGKAYDVKQAGEEIEALLEKLIAEVSKKKWVEEEPNTILDEVNEEPKIKKKAVKKK